MPTYVATRVLQAMPVLAGIALLNFVIMHLAPGDIVDVLAGDAGGATPEYMAQLRHAFGLDQPLWVQLYRYLASLARFDLGFSHRAGLPVLTLILSRLPATVLLMTTALAGAVSVGLLLGLAAAARVHSWVDGVISVAVMMLHAVPPFWLGLMTIVLFSVTLGWLPSGGMVSLEHPPSGFAALPDVARHLVLPAATLANVYLAIYTRLVRSALLELHDADFIRTARAKGAPEWRVTLVHALRNALLPMVTMLGLQTSALLSGAVVVESVFGWPGLGRLAFEAVLSRDLNLLLGILFLSSILVLGINLLVDLLYGLLDPRVSLGRG